MKTWFKYFVHCSLVHPWMPFLPTKLAEAMHAKNAKWAFPEG
jgi:hypothetical protein